MLRVLIADDHPVVRRGVMQMLATVPGIVVCGEADSGLTAVELALALTPDVIIMDLLMPEFDGIEATRRLRAANSPSEVVMYTSRGSEHLVLEALLCGAKAYVLKTDAPEILRAGVDSVARHISYVTPSLMTPNVTQLLKGPSLRVFKHAILTQRERQILRLVAEGFRTRQIAAELSISEKTVETHRAAMMRKLRVTNVVGLVRVALRHGLVSE